MLKFFALDDGGDAAIAAIDEGKGIRLFSYIPCQHPDHTHIKWFYMKHPEAWSEKPKVNGDYIEQLGVDASPMYGDRRMACILGLPWRHLPE